MITNHVKKGAKKTPKACQEMGNFQNNIGITAFFCS
jgi:hypothetical protein